MDRTNVSDIAFTPSVKAVQEKLGSRAGYQKWRSGVASVIR